MPEISIEELRAWTKACDPLRPIARGDAYFVDFNRFEYEGQFISLRGNTTETGLASLADAIVAAESMTSCHLFSGFSGTGKSTELLGLAQELEKQRYIVLIADALEYINLKRPLEVSELLIIAAAAFGEVAAKRLGRSLGKPGYFAWRTGLYRFHADTAGELMHRAGYDEATIARVKAAVGKQDIKSNADTQVLEDVSSLVFIEHYMLGFAGQHADYSEEKWLGIIRKTWKKMSPAAQVFATTGGIHLPEALVPLILKAISDA